MRISDWSSDVCSSDLDRTLLAMPEVGIGLFPDVGGTYFLPRLPGRLGLFLALTGWRLNAADAIFCGLATDYVPSERMDALAEAFAEQIGRAHVCTPVTNAHLVCRLLLEKTKKQEIQNS